MRLPPKDSGLTSVVLVLTVLFVVPPVIGLGFWLTAPSGTDAPLLFGILGSLVAPSCFLLACSLGSFLSGLFGD